MQTNYIYIAVLAVLVIVAGVGEYLKFLPAGTFAYLFFIVVGALLPSPIQRPVTPVIGPNTNVKVEAPDAERTGAPPAA